VDCSAAPSGDLIAARGDAGFAPDNHHLA